jgi:hypothetical protein
MTKTSSSYSESTSPNPFGLTTPSLGDWLKLQNFKYNPSQNQLYPSTSDSQTTLPTGDPYSQRVKDELDYAKGYFPIWQQMQQSAAKASADSTRQQMSDLFPYLSAASAEATARNLAASTQFLLAKEQTPTAQALRNQIAQSQIESSQSGEAKRDIATATQAQAAKEFARGYAGTTFRTT